MLRVFDLLDSFFFLMAVPNVIGLLIMAPVIKRDLTDYLARIKAGAIERNA